MKVQLWADPAWSRSDQAKSKKTNLKMSSFFSNQRLEKADKPAPLISFSSGRLGGKKVIFKLIILPIFLTDRFNNKKINPPPHSLATWLS